MSGLSVTAPKLSVFLFGLGAALHAALIPLRMFHRNPADPHTTSLVLVLNIALIVLGGFFYALLLRWAVAEAMEPRMTRFEALIRATLVGGLLGATSTVMALQGSYIAGAAKMMWETRAVAPSVDLGDWFAMAIIDLETYGLIEMMMFVIPGFILGALATVLVTLWARNRFLQSHPELRPA